jgi:hypothetical protein
MLYHLSHAPVILSLFLLGFALFLFLVFIDSLHTRDMSPSYVLCITNVFLQPCQLSFVFVCGGLFSMQSFSLNTTRFINLFYLWILSHYLISRISSSLRFFFFFFSYYLDCSVVFPCGSLTICNLVRNEQWLPVGGLVSNWHLKSALERRFVEATCSNTEEGRVGMGMIMGDIFCHEGHIWTPQIKISLRDKIPLSRKVSW